MKKVLPFLLTGVLLACTCSVPSRMLPTPTATLPGTIMEPTKVETESAYTILELLPEDGDLSELLRNEAPKAVALGQHMFVEFDAAW